MGALVMLVLAADLAQEPVAAAEPPPQEEPAWNLGAQVSITALQSLNGAFLGFAACGATPCSSDSTAPIVFGVLGAGTGFALSLIDREPARGWGRAAFLDSAIVGAGVFSIAVGTGLGLGQQIGYSVIFLGDAALTAGALIAARHLSPRPEAVLLADSLGLWGLVIGGAAATLAHSSNPGSFLLGGALGGLAVGAALGFTAPRMAWWRVLIANGAALVGALVLGGGLSMYESWVATPRRPYDPVVPAAGVAAGVAGGFLAGFALSESL